MKWHVLGLVCLFTALPCAMAQTFPDLDGDGHITASDVRLFSNQWRLRGGGWDPQADFTGDNRLDHEDAAVLVENMVRPSPITGPVVLADNARLLPNDGSVQALESQPGHVTLTGAVPPLSPGDVLISQSGEGLLCKITSVAAVGDAVIAETEPATLEDAFKELHIRWAGLANLDGLVPGDGVMLDELTPAVVGPATTSPMAAWKGDVMTRQHFRIDCDLYSAPPGKLILRGDGYLTVPAEFSIDLDDDYGLTYARCAIGADLDLEARLYADGRIQTPIKYSRLVPLVTYYGMPITVGPVVIIPVFELGIGIDVSVVVDLKLGVTCNVSARVVGGGEYRDGSAHLIGEHVGKLADGSSVRVSALTEGEVKGQVTITPAIFAGRLKVYALAGPYIALKLGGTAEVKVVADPLGVDTLLSRDAWIFLNATGGLELGAFGSKWAECSGDFFQYRYHLPFYPLVDILKGDILVRPFGLPTDTISVDYLVVK